MNFLGVGPLELMVILVVALLVVGPERLPRLAADIARTIREIRRYTGSVAAEFNEVVKEIEKETSEERTEWKQVGEGLTDASRSVTESVRGARRDAEATPASPNGHGPGASAPSASAMPGPTTAPPGPERGEGGR